MKNYYFRCHSETTDKQQFTKMVGMLEELINKIFTYLQDMALMCKTFETVTLSQPPNLTKSEYNGDMGKKMIWGLSMKTYLKRLDLLLSNSQSIYPIVWGQCSPSMQAKLIELLDQFPKESVMCNCIWLLKEIRGMTHQFEGTRNILSPWTMRGAINTLADKDRLKCYTTT